MKKVLSFLTVMFFILTTVSYAQMIPTSTSGSGGGGGPTTSGSSTSGSTTSTSSCTTCECLGTCPDECSLPNPPCYCTDSCGLTDRCEVPNPPCDCTGTCSICVGNIGSPLCGEPACGSTRWTCSSGIATGQSSPIYPNRTYTWSCMSEFTGYSIACRETVKNTCVSEKFTAQPTSFANICTFGGFISTGATLETVGGVQTNYFMGYCPDDPQYHACKYDIGNFVRVSASDGSDSQSIAHDGTALFTVTIHNIYAESLTNISVLGLDSSNCSLSPSQSAGRYSGGASAYFDPDESFTYNCRVSSASVSTFSQNRFVISASGKGRVSGQQKNASDPTTVFVAVANMQNTTPADQTTASSGTANAGTGTNTQTTSGTDGKPDTNNIDNNGNNTVVSTSTSGTSVTSTTSTTQTTTTNNNNSGNNTSSSQTNNITQTTTAGSSTSGSSVSTSGDNGNNNISTPIGNTNGTVIDPPITTLSDIQGKLFYDENKDGIAGPGEGVSGVQTEISQKDSNTKWYNTTDGNGDFWVKRIPDGNYELRISGNTDVFFPAVIPVVIQGGDFQGTFSGFRKADIEKNPEIVSIFNLKIPDGTGTGSGITDIFDPIINPEDISNVIFGPTLDNPYFGITTPEVLTRDEELYNSNEGNVCGNGTIDPGETCDDFDKNGQPGYCSANCLFDSEAVPVTNNNLGSNSLSPTSPQAQDPAEKTGIIQTVKNAVSSVRSAISERVDRVFQQVASANVIRQSVNLLDQTIGIENIKSGIDTTIKVAKVVAEEAVVVAQYSVAGVVSLLSVAAVGSNIMVFKAHWMKYTVQEGDTLESLSDKFTMTTRKIGQKNRMLGKGGKLEPGMRITVRNRHFMEKDYLDQLKFVLKDVLEKRHLGKMGKTGVQAEKPSGIDVALDTAFDFTRKYISPVFETAYTFLRKIV